MSRGKNKRPELIYSESLKEKARELRNNPTPSERLFWDLLRTMPFYEEITFNRQKPIGNFIVDFYSYRLRLAVEIDGDTHGHDSRIAGELNRTAYLESKGLRVLRFTNREVLKNVDKVMERVERVVEEQLGKSP
ncbi:MAG: endonuclease domain-containing protein [Nitrospinaceae bacterium]